MTHEEASVLLDEYAAGQLDAARRAAVEAHLQVCPACRGILRIAVDLRRAASEAGEALVSDHPAAESLASYALADGGLPIAEAASIQAHLEVCATCRREADLVGRAGRRRGGPPWTRAITPLALAAVLLLTLWPAVRQRSPGRQPDTIIEPAPAMLLYLAEPTRTIATEAPSVDLTAGQQVLPVAVAWTDDLQPRGLSVTVLAEIGERPLLSFTLDAAEALDADLGVLGLVLPASALAEGRHRLVILATDGGAILADRVFAVRRR